MHVFCKLPFDRLFFVRVLAQYRRKMLANLSSHLFIVGIRKEIFYLTFNAVSDSAKKSSSFQEFKLCTGRINL